jgi:soluble lytic murein transglycosylase
MATALKQAQRLAAALAAAVVLASPSWAQAQAPMRAGQAVSAAISVTAQDQARLRQGLSDARANRWDAVRAARDAASDPLVRRILSWRIAADPDAPASYPEISRALDDLGGWPARETMRRRGEQQIFDAGLSAQTQIIWLTAEGGPVSGDGQIALAIATANSGRRTEGVAIAREAWRTRNLTARGESEALARFGDNFTADDHAQRADILLWREERSAAARMAARLRGGERALLDARLALQTRRSKGLSKILAAVPESRREDPGLLFDRARYVRRQGRPEDAMPLISRIKASEVVAAGREELFEERRLYIPRALRAGDRRSAYRLAADHGLQSGERFADAEWLAGWIALRFLKEPTTAQTHFERLETNVRAPVSRARALYWRAEAEAASGDRPGAEGFLAQAAQLDYTFYGQLAAAKLNRNPVLALGEAIRPSTDERAAFESRELVRALRLMALSGERQDFESIAFYLDDQLQAPVEYEMLGAIARENGYPFIAVRAAKAGLRRGIVAKESAYPLMALPDDAKLPGRPESALIHAITRQETEFNPQAISRAGARGMMQLMPATAQATARRFGMGYDRNRLLADPAYNVSLGAAHLGELVDDFSGSYVMAIAAYNAGSSRPRQWMEDWGDPRTGAIDIVDWIELIPFSETRNYVMRVTENLQVYRARLNGGTAPLQITQDLARGAR